jgi:hypothetical protein
MSPARLAAAMLLVLLLPVQGYAAACAQICALAEGGRQATVVDATSAAAHESADPAGHCHDSEPQSHPGSGKCCSAHTFLVELAQPIPPAAPEALAHDAFVARWTNFIPEEPSPPPIASLRFA